jgi:uncharacterized protein (DUF58 family)
VTATATRSSAATSPELTNARTRIVGASDGVLANTVIWMVRLARGVRVVTARVWAWLSRIVSPLGWCAFVLTTAAFFAAYALGWAEAVVIAWALVIVLAAAVLFVLGRNAFEVQVSLPVARVVVGERAPGGLWVRNGSHRRVPGGRIEVPIGYGLAEFVLPSLPRRGVFEDVFIVPTSRRGIIQVGPMRTVRSDPFGLMRREVVWDSTAELFVHPHTIAIPSMSTGFVRDLEGNPTRDVTASDVSFHALREYVPGDEPRTIHWKSTAKTGSYMVRQFEETRRSHLMVTLSLAEGDYASDGEFELAVSVAGSLGVRAIRDGRTVSVVSSKRTPDFAKHVVVALRQLSTVTPTRLLDDLAGVERAGTHLHVAELARIAAQSAVGVSVAFVICGSPAGIGQLRHASAHYPAGVEVVAVVCDPGAVPGLRRVGELSLLTIGYLDDPQKSLARSRAT